MSTTNKLQEIQQVIDRFDFDLARQMIRDEIQIMPSADLFVLAARATNEMNQKLLFIDQALRLDPNHIDARVMRDKLSNKLVDRATSHQQHNVHTKALAQISIQSVVEPQKMNYAGFWKRFAAAFIDGIIVIISSMIIGFIFGIIMVMGGTKDSSTLETLGNILGFFLSWLYYSVMESSPTQGTFGKMALGIKVTDLSGDRVSFGKATGRYFGKILSGLTLFVGYIMIAFTEKKQGLHDVVAGCLVVDK